MSVDQDRSIHVECGERVSVDLDRSIHVEFECLWTCSCRV